jgi:hypothetical protein
MTMNDSPSVGDMDTKTLTSFSSWFTGLWALVDLFEPTIRLEMRMKQPTHSQELCAVFRQEILTAMDLALADSRTEDLVNNYEDQWKIITDVFYSLDSVWPYGFTVSQTLLPGGGRRSITAYTGCISIMLRQQLVRTATQLLRPATNVALLVCKHNPALSSADFFEFIAGLPLTLPARLGRGKLLHLQSWL